MLVGTHVLLLLVPGGELKDGGEAHVLLLLVPDVELDGSATGGESICFSELFFIRLVSGSGGSLKFF